MAIEFRKRYPAMYEEYRRRCKAKPHLFNPGEVMFWKSETSPHVFNLATQEDTLLRRATYSALEKALTLMQQIADQEAITGIAMPRICAGLGGGLVEGTPDFDAHLRRLVGRVVRLRGIQAGRINFSESQIYWRDGNFTPNGETT